MKKKLSIEDIEKSVTKLENGENTPNNPDKTDVAFTKKKKKKRRIRRYIILTIVALIIAGLGYFGFVSYNSLKNIFGGDGAPSLLGLFDKTQLKGEGSGRVNVLIMGIGDEGHAGQNLTDTLMVLSIDTRNKKAAMLSIPRDLYVKIPNYGYSKINAAHAYGEKKEKGQGPDLAMETVSGILDVPIQYYVRVDFTGFKKLIDTVGGVDINVEKDLYDPYYPGPNDRGYVTVNIKKGMQHMDGDTALKYARSRETTSDFDRAKRQQQVMVAVKDKILSPSTLFNPKKLSDIVGILGAHIKTNFQTNEFQRIIELGKQIDSSKMVTKVLDNSANGLLVSGNYYGYTLVPKLGIDNYSDIQALAKNIFDESTSSKESARIAVLNGTTKEGLATGAAQKLTSQGYNVVYYGTASKKRTSTVIYDYTNGGKPKTVEALTKLFNATVVKATGGSYDIEIVLGSNYKP